MTHISYIFLQHTSESKTDMVDVRLTFCTEYDRPQHMLCADKWYKEGKRCHVP